MKRMFTRIAACSLAVLIAFNTVAVPKSKALALESAFCSSVTASFMMATGFAMNANGEWSGTSADMYIAERLDEFLRDFAEAREMTKAQFEAELNEGVEIIRNGVISLSASAANALRQFSVWLVDKLGLIDESGDSVGDVPFVYEWVDYPPMPDVDLGMYPFWVITTDEYLYFSRRDSVICTDGYFLVTSNPTDAPFYALENGQWVLKGYGGQWSFDYIQVRYVSEDCVKDGEVMLFGSAFPSSYETDNPLLFVSLPSDYEVPPPISEQHAMVIDTGMTFEDQQTLIDSILAGAASGSLAPTYTIENSAGSDVVVPDEDEDTQRGILSWVKHIAQSIISLPQAIADKFAAFPRTIAEAVSSYFVPDVALTTEITNTFSEKFAFMSTLHELGQDLLNIGPDPKPPVVYIHLENAEGAIRYGGTEKALDMSWYERYKPTGDAVISGFLWLGFLWLLFKRAAAIIRGAEMVSDYSNDFDVGGRGGRHR